MKQILSLFLLVTIVGLIGSTGVAFAHEHSQNNGVTAEMHVEPDDNPKAGQATELRLSFEDDSKVTPANCDCMVTIRKGKQDLYQTKLPAVTTVAGDDEPGSIVRFTFPVVGAYEVILTGTPKSADYSKFALSFPVTVKTAVPIPASKSAKAADRIALAGGVAAVIGLIAFGIIGSRRKTQA